MSSLASTLLLQAAAEYVATSSGAAANFNRAARDASQFVTGHAVWFIAGAIALFVLWRLVGPAR